MKKRITAIILAVLMCLSTVGTFASSAAVTTTDRYDTEITKIAGMELKLSNEDMELYVNEATAEIAIRNKVTKEIMLSNPYNATDRYLSQLILTYRSTGAAVSTTYNSYNDCILYNNNQVTYQYTEDSVIVTYDFGEKVETFLLPNLIGYNEMQAIIAKLKEIAPDTYQNTFLRNYDYVSVTLGEPDENGNRAPVKITDYQKGIYIERYRANGIEEEALYALKEAVSDDRKEKAEELLIQTGYTEEQRAEDYKKINYVHVDADTAYPGFIVPLEYKLTDNGFIAEVDASKISYKRDSLSLEAISVLPYMNAGIRNDKGYNFLPDGSGALVRFEDITSQNANNDITFKLYGLDNAFYALETKILEQATMPVFGMMIDEKPNRSGFFAIIENGDAVASITSAHNANYHSVYASFQLNAADSLQMVNSSTGVDGNLNIKSDAIFTDRCAIRYTMLSPVELGWGGYDTSYLGMADCYRDYLTAKGDIEKLTSAEADKKTKLFLEVFGSMKVEKKIASFPVTVNEALTTFDEVMLIQDELSKAGIGPMNFILTGFANEGISTKYPTKLKWLNSVGGKKGFEELLLDAEAKGYEVSPNLDFVYSTYLYGSDNINYRKYGSKSLDKRFSMKLTYDPGLQMLAFVGGIVISTGSYDYAYEKFAESAEKYDIKNAAVRTLGSDLNSDFNEDDFKYRTETLVDTANMLANLSGKADGAKTDYKLLVDKGNAYTYAYVSYITKAPLDSSRLINESEAIPFSGMVLHGSITFTGEALNMEGDDKYAFLKALENGANLYFTIAYDNVEYLKLNWRFSQYYSIRYDLWKDFIIEKYTEYNNLMQSKQDSYITEHEFLNTSEADGRFNVYRTDTKAGLENSRVVRVEYENGEGFFLNYNPEFEVTVEYGGKTFNIPALGYAAYSNLDA